MAGTDQNLCPTGGGSGPYNCAVIQYNRAMGYHTAATEQGANLYVTGSTGEGNEVITEVMQPTEFLGNLFV